MSQIVFKNPYVSVSPAVIGTGNGTLTVDRLTHFTIAQVYTLTCVAKTPDTLFSVAGSLDSAVGVATVGSQFFDAELKIFLTIQQGGTPFEVGDQITFTVVNGTDVDQENIDSFDELPQKNFGAGTFGFFKGDHNLRYSNTSKYAFLFIEDLKFVAKTAGSAGNSVTVQLVEYIAPVKASRTIQDLTFTADTAGTAGNSITIQYTNTGTAGAEIVNVVSSAISVAIQSGVSTATQIKAAIDAFGAAAALVDTTISGTGSTAQTTTGPLALTGGIAEYGSSGGVAIDSTSNSIKAIIHSGSSTPSAIKTAIEGDTNANSLVTVSVIGSTTVPQYAGSAYSLYGGKNKDYSFNHDELTDSGSFAEANANANAKDVNAGGNLSVTKHAQIGGVLSLADTDSGPTVSNTQRYINALIKQGILQVSAVSGTFIDWTSNSLTCSANIEVYFREGSIKNTINMTGGISLTDGQSAYIVFNYDTTSTLTATLATTVPANIFAFRLATRVGTLLIMYNGAVLAAGEQARIGNAGSASTSTANSIIRRDSSADFAAHDATLNRALVAPGSGKGLDVSSAGDLYIGASVGANTLKVGGASSTVEILGDLIVQGATTTLNVATLDVEDKNIKVNLNGNDATSEGAGLTVARTGTSGSLIYATAAATKFKIGDLGSEVEITDISTAQTLTNKKLSDSTTTIVDVSDPTKIIKFDAGGTTGTKTTITGAQTADRVLTLPDATDTLVGKATTDSLTNKSLVDSSTNVVDVSDPTKKIAFDAGGTTGTKTTITGAQTADRVLTLPDATDTLVGKATTDSLTNKSLVDSSTNIVDVSDPTKKIAFDAGGTTSTKTTITGAQTADRVLTLPDATDTLVGLAVAQTLTTKTMAVGSNHITGTLGKIGQFNASTGDLEASSSAVSDLVAKASYRAGSAALSSTDTSKAISFTTLGTTSYRIMVQIVNITDASVQYQPITITAKAATGFTASWNGGVDSANYVLEYFAVIDN